MEGWLRAARAAWAEAHAREGHTKGARQAQASETPAHLLGEIAALQAVLAGFYDGDAGTTQAFCQAGWDTSKAGRLRKAWQFTERAIHLVQTPDGYVPASVCWLYARQADMLREWNRLEEAQNLVEQAIQLGEQTETLAFLPIGYTMLLKLALSRGAREEAKSAHQQMEDAWRAMPAPYRFALESRGEQIRFWLACGDLERARTWADSLEQEEPLVSPLARERQEVAPPSSENKNSRGGQRPIWTPFWLP